MNIFKGREFTEEYWFYNQIKILRATITANKVIIKTDGQYIYY